MIKQFIFIYLIVFCVCFSQAQVGGTNTYEFLNLPTSARITALGGKIASIDESDPAMVSMNPSLLNSSMDKSMSLNYTPYYAGINYGYVAYGSQIRDSSQMLLFGIQYANYGSFDESDSRGIITGKFSASDYVVNISYSRAIDSNLFLGASVKPVYSDYTYYNSFGLLSDLGITYKSKDHLFVASVVLRNAGFQLWAYTPSGREPIPFEILAGFSQKLKYAPLRFIVTFQQLQRFDLSYQLLEENTAKIKGTETDNKSKIENIATNALKHVITGIEFVPSKNFFGSVSLNFKRRSELSIIDKPGMVGFSYGFGVKIKKLRITYGHSAFSLAGSYNVFSLNTVLSELYLNNKNK